MTNHSYFRLGREETVLDHQLYIDAETYYILDKDSLPVEKRDVKEDPPFDFTEEKPIRKAVAAEHPQIQNAGDGIDHPFLFNEPGDKRKAKVSLRDESSGMMMRVYTEDQAVVIYTGNQMVDGYSVRNRPVQKYGAVCIETQTAPDHLDWTVVSPDTPYRKETVFSFA